MSVYVTWGRRRSSIFDLSHIGGLSPNPTIPLLVSPQVLYALQNVALVEIADPSRYAVELADGGYYRVQPGDADDYALFLETVNQVGLQLSDYLTMSTLWNFKEPYHEEVHENNAAAGTNTLAIYGGGTGVLRVIDAVTVYDSNNAVAYVFLRLGPEGGEVYVETQQTLTAGIPRTTKGPFHLYGGERLQAVFLGCTAGDDIHLEFSGYTMELLT